MQKWISFRRSLACVFTSLFFVTTATPPAKACSAFSFDEDSVYVAKNYDWVPLHGHGAVFINKRGVAKTAQTLRTQNAVGWISKYGSVTFSQMGAEFPVSGVNEAGLSAEILQLEETQNIPETDPRPALNEAQWLQFQLDNFATVADVMAHVDQYRVEKAFLGVHYFVCDRTGECGVFEYLNGRLVVHNGSQVAPKLLTNSTYEDSIASVSGDHAIVHEGPFAASAKSLRRFAAANELLKNKSSSNQVGWDFAFDVLKKIEMNTFLRTQWSMVYDLSLGLVEFKTKSQPSRKKLNLAEIDFSCASPMQMMDIHQPKAGDARASLKDFSYEANKALVDENWLLLGADLRKLAAEYPMSHTQCVQP